MIIYMDYLETNNLYPTSIGSAESDHTMWQCWRSGTGGAPGDDGS